MIVLWVILSILLLGGIGVGIYFLTKSSSKTTPVTTSKNNRVTLQIKVGNIEPKV